MVEILEVLGLFILAAAISIILAVSIVGAGCFIIIAIDEGIYFIKENYKKDD